MPSRPAQSTPHPQLHPNAAMLRCRSATLRSFAETLEGLVVTQLDRSGVNVDADCPQGETNRAHLRHMLLRYNLQQLHQAADDLRDVALRMCQDANGIELAHRVAALPDSAA